MPSNPRILITGHTGFIGTKLFQRMPDPAQVEGFALTEGNDIRDARALQVVFDRFQPEVVIHLAALTGVRNGELEPIEYLHTNILGTQNVIQACQQFDVKHLIHFSSSSVFGAPDSRQLNENDPKNPQSLYGMTKLMGEYLVNRCALRTTIVRPFTVYGPQGRKDQVLQRWFTAIAAGQPVPFYGDGLSSRGYTHVDDLIDGILKILEQPEREQHTTYNLGGAETINLRDLFDELKNILAKHQVDITKEDLPAPAADQRANSADTTKARTELGWTPTHRMFTELEALVQAELLPNLPEARPSEKPNEG